MAAHRMRARFARSISVGISAVLIASISLGSIASAESPGKSKLSKHDRQQLAAATASGATTVTMLFATVESSTGSVASALRSLGATVRKQDSEFGYIRADVPTDKADFAAKIAGVLGSELDETYSRELPDAGGDASVLVDPPGAATPSENAYMPTRDIGAPQFVAAHPTWDGRGITIGILDTGVDLGHPALQTTSTGDRKVIDWVTYTDPTTDGDPSWVALSTALTITGGTFTVGTRTWTGAPNGSFKFGTFSEDHPSWANLGGGAAAEYRIACANRPGLGGGDLNRDGNCGDVFAFLWDGGEKVWVDSDADGSFADEHAMREYKKAFEIGEYGHDNPATAVRESVPFVIQIDAASSSVSLGIVSGAHGTHVAGITSGNGFFDGAYDGVAPGAKIVSIRVCLFTSGCTAHALLEGMIYAVKTANVDVVNMSIGGLPSLNDGNNARAILYNSLINKKGAQLFLSAGNSGPGVNTVGDPSVATKVMSVGAYWHKDTVLANYGNVVPGPEAIHDFSSRGPREDGGFKPDIIAPGSAVSGVPTWQAGQPVAGTYALPPGYGMFNGTSMASPQAAGAAALLLSAVKANGKNSPDQLRQALRSSARFIPGVQAHEQGAGLINVGAAYEVLRHNIKTAEISSSVATNTKLSSFLATPGFGTGIYDREGVIVGSAPYTRTYTFSRADGGNATYNLSWIGNDGTFSLATNKLDLGKNKPATLTVTVTPGAAGAHSAILVLDDPKTQGIDYQTMNTVLVAIPLNAGNAYSATISGTASKFQASQPKMFFAVPDGTTAMRMTLTVTNGGRVNATALHPYGVPLTAVSQAIPFTTGPAAPVSRVLTTGPIPGTWEVVSAASRAAVPDNSTFTITYEAYKVTLDPASWTQAATIGTPYTQTFAAKNEFAAATTVQTAAAFASASSTTATIPAAGPQQTYDVTVPAGTTSLNVSIGGASDPGADLDLFLYRCTSATSCTTLVGVSGGSTAVESITIANPTPALYRAVVDPFAIPAGSTSYTYSDALSNPVYGSVIVPPNAPTARPSGATWSFIATGQANASANTPSGTGRFLRSSVSVRLDSATGPALTSATVIFNTP